MVDLCANRINTHALESIVKLSLKANNDSIVAFDARMNTGTTDKLLYQIATCMLKNIMKHRVKGIEIPREFIKPELYSFKKINIKILEGLQLKHNPEIWGIKVPKRSKSVNRSTNNSGANTLNKGEDAILDSLHASTDGDRNQRRGSSHLNSNKPTNIKVPSPSHSQAAKPGQQNPQKRPSSAATRQAYIPGAALP